MGGGPGFRLDSADPPTARVVLTLLAIAVVVSMAVSALSFPPCPTEDDGKEAPGKGPVSEWQAMWEKIEAEGYQSLAPDVAAQPSLRAAGDTCGMRYRGLFDGLPREAKHAFQVIAFSNDPDSKLRLLERSVVAGEAMVRQRAYLEIARVQLRQGRGEAALATLAAARRLAGPSSCQADLAFMEGYIRAERSDVEQALHWLREAVRLDPGFWNARQVLVAVLTQRLHGPGLTANRCLELTRLLIENLGALPQLAQDVKQFRTIADHVAGNASGGNAATSLVAGLGYQWGGDHQRSRALFEQGQQARSALPPACRRLIEERLHKLLEEQP